MRKYQTQEQIDQDTILEQTKLSAAAVAIATKDLEDENQNLNLVINEQRNRILQLEQLLARSEELREDLGQDSSYYYNQAQAAFALLKTLI